MKLYPPFIIGPRLLPALVMSEMTVSLQSKNFQTSSDGRHQAHLIIDLDGQTYHDQTLRSGVGGGWTIPEIFETYLGFMEHVGAAERDDIQDNDSCNLFRPAVVKWITENLDEVQVMRNMLCDDSGAVHKNLIEE